MTREHAPDGSEVNEAMAARRAFKQMIRYDDTSRIDNLERKSLSAFSCGTNSFLLTPEPSTPRERQPIADTPSAQRGA